MILRILEKCPTGGSSWYFTALTPEQLKEQFYAYVKGNPDDWDAQTDWDDAGDVYQCLVACGSARWLRMMIEAKVLIPVKFHHEVHLVGDEYLSVMEEPR